MHIILEVCWFCLSKIIKFTT